MPKRYTQRELEIFVRCWQTATNLEGLVTALKDHPEHRTIIYEEDWTRRPEAGFFEVFTDSEKRELESKRWRIKDNYTTRQEGTQCFRVVYQSAHNTFPKEANIDWAKRRATTLRRKGVKLKRLGSIRRSSGVNYASLGAVASEYR